MSLSTYTCTVFNNTPKAVHVGDQSVSGQIQWGATSTVGDTAFLAKIPQGAVIVDIIEYHTTGAATQVLKFGLARGGAAGGGASLSCLISSGAQATMNRSSVKGFPVQVSVSDNDPNRYAELVATVKSGTTTTSLKLSFTVIYRMDGPPPYN